MKKLTKTLKTILISLLSVTFIISIGVIVSTSNKKVETVMLKFLNK